MVLQPLKLLINSNYHSQSYIRQNVIITALQQAARLQRSANSLNKKEQQEIKANKCVQDHPQELVWKPHFLQAYRHWKISYSPSQPDC